MGNDSGEWVRNTRGTTNGEWLMDAAQIDNTEPAGEDTADTETKPLISVIVPIYNVEKYVRKCLESLRGQSLKQIEVICIDDGSTDDSGKIADEYVASSVVGGVQFRVIHTENRGLSAARNRGIDESVGDWIMFVDSDDWVEPGFCEIPYKAAMEYGADLVIFEADLWKNGKKQKRKKNNSTPVGLIDEFIAHEYGSTVAWNKLYKKKLFDTIRYPEGHVYEDLATTHKLVHSSEQITILQTCLYHYVYRCNSISHTHTAWSKRDSAVFLFQRCEALISYGCPEEKISTNLFTSAIGVLANTELVDDELHMRAKSILTSFEMPTTGLNMKKKIALMAWKTNEQLFYLLCRVTGRGNYT